MWLCVGSLACLPLRCYYCKIVKRSSSNVKVGRDWHTSSNVKVGRGWHTSSNVKVGAGIQVAT